MKNYQDRFVEVVVHIEANLDSRLDIDQLCRLVHISKYHFHRQCSAFFGMSVMSLVKLLKLKRASYQLAYRHNKKILDIALMNGYESHEAFSRTFRQHFGTSPSEFRKSPDWNPWHSQYEPIFQLRNRLMNDVNLNVEVVNFPRTLIAAMEHRGSPKQLGKTIAKFIDWRKRNKLSPGISKTFNLVYDDPDVTSPGDYRFDVCCSVQMPVQENPEGIINKVIPAGKYAKVRHTGSDDTIGATVQYLYSAWLPTSSYEPRDFPIFFERISFFPDVPEGEMVTDVYLPIE